MNIPDWVRRKALLKGDIGEAWLDDVGEHVARLARDWDFELGTVLDGGTEALVAEVILARSEPAILKILVAGQDPDRTQIHVLRQANGRGYARLLRADETVNAMLLERLGEQLDRIHLPIDAQIERICATLEAAWSVPSAGLNVPDGAHKAVTLATLITTEWPKLGRPCGESVIDTALEFARRRERAFDPRDVVLAHGDAHAWNTLADPQRAGRFKFVDPDGLVIERAYDLAIPMREWPEALLPDPVSLARRRCRLLARFTGVDAQAIWEWGFIERVSTGLVLKQLGIEPTASDFLSVADACAGVLRCD
jgi:streptomycin 6-kinase